MILSEMLFDSNHHRAARHVTVVVLISRLGGSDLWTARKFPSTRLTEKSGFGSFLSDRLDLTTFFRLRLFRWDALRDCYCNFAYSALACL
jgi:hypothetical protein